MTFKLTKVFTSSVFLLFSLPSLALQETEAQAQPAPEAYKGDVERITVYGQKSLYKLKKEIRKKSQAFFKDYNKINDINQFAIVCIKEKRAGSNFKAKTCEPSFVRSNRTQMTAALVFGNDPSSLSGIDLGAEGTGGTTIPLAFSRLAMVNGLSGMSISQKRRFDEHVDKLLLENPELLEKYKDILDLQSAYAYKKRND